MVALVVVIVFLRVGSNAGAIVVGAAVPYLPML
jgi:hypothetical protein